MGVPSAISVNFQPPMSAVPPPVLTISTYSSDSDVGTTPSKKMHAMVMLTAGVMVGAGVGRAVAVGAGIAVTVGVAAIVIAVAVGLAGMTVAGGDAGAVVAVTVGASAVGVYAMPGVGEGVSTTAVGVGKAVGVLVGVGEDVATGSGTGVRVGLSSGASAGDVGIAGAVVGDGIAEPVVVSGVTVGARSPHAMAARDSRTRTDEATRVAA